MYEPLRYLADASPLPLSCLPNAGLPSVVDGKMHYDLTRTSSPSTSRGSSPSSARARSAGAAAPRRRTWPRSSSAVRGVEPARSAPVLEPAAASIYTSVPFRQDLERAPRRRAHERERVQEVPRGDAARGVGHLRRDGARPDQGGRARPRRVRRLHGGRRGRRHGRAHGAARHPVLRAAHGRHDRGARRTQRRSPGSAGARCSTASTSRRARTRARASTASSRSRASSAPRSSPPASTRRARRAPRSGRCAPRRRIVGARRGPLRAARRGPLHRPARAAAVDRARGVAPRRHRDDRGDPPALDRARRACTRSSGSRTSRSASAPRARQALNSVFLHECARGGPRRRDRAREQDPAARARSTSAAREACLDLIYDRRRDGYDPLIGAPRAVRGRQRARARAVDDLDGPRRRRAARPAHHRREPHTGCPRTSTRRSATGSAPSRS